MSVIIKIFISGFYPFVLFILLFITSCGNVSEIDNSIVDNLTEYEKIKTLLIPIISEIKNGKDSVINPESIIFHADLSSFEKKALYRNNNELNQILKIWKSSKTEDKLSFIRVDGDSTIDFSVKFHNGGITDYSYSHSIIYDPNNRYNIKANVCQDIVLVKTIKGSWKYLICRTTFG